MAADGAAGDCVFAGEPFQAAAADRTVVRDAAVAGVRDTGPVRREIPTRKPNNKERCGEEKGKNSSRGKAPRLNVVTEDLRRGLLKARGPRGQAAAISGLEIG